MGRACPQTAMHEAGGTSSSRRTAHLVIPLGRWLELCDPWSLLPSESRYWKEALVPPYLRELVF